MIHEEKCACGCGHEHGAHTHGDGDRKALVAEQKLLSKLKGNLAEIEAIHAKIDDAFASVSRENIGMLLTQKKNLKTLKKLFQKTFAGAEKHQALSAMKKAEEGYIENVEDILHTAQVMKRADRGNVTGEVVRNLEKALFGQNLQEKAE